MTLSIVVLTYNRLPALTRTLETIRKGTRAKKEIFVVDNASTDGTHEYLMGLKDPEITIITRPTNEGVIARNYAFRKARYEIIAQVDDDAIVDNGWDSILLPYFKDPKIGMVGIQGGLIRKWLSLSVYESNGPYVDFLTGFLMMFRNCGIRYDERFAPFWHEELMLSLKFKEKGYKLIAHRGNGIGSHASLRKGEIDWGLHDRNLKYIYDEWKDCYEKLNLAGMQK